jgi:3-oxoacyl-[acyl-carrier protein] reductase
MLNSIDGRSVIVTGASKGIGKGIAKVFASKGARILVAARNLDPAEATAKEIRAAGGAASALAADVSNWADTQRIAAAAIKEFGGIDILCANAGIFPAAKLDELTTEAWDEVLSTNLKGTFLAIKACLPAMKAKRKGRIVITSSITGPAPDIRAGLIMERAKRARLVSCIRRPSSSRRITSRSTQSCPATSRQKA